MIYNFILLAAGSLLFVRVVGWQQTFDSNAPFLFISKLEKEIC